MPRKSGLDVLYTLGQTTVTSTFSPVTGRTGAHLNVLRPD